MYEKRVLYRIIVRTIVVIKIFIFKAVDKFEGTPRFSVFAPH